MVRAGDTNTRFFHYGMRWTRLKKELKGVEDYGSWCEDPIREKMVVQKFLRKDFVTRVINIEFSTVLEEENKMLTSTVFVCVKSRKQ